MCKQTDRVTAPYLRQVWDKNDWLLVGQHGLSLGYSSESQSRFARTLQTLDNRARLDTIIIHFLKAFNLVLQNYDLWHGLEFSHMRKGFHFGPYAES